MTQQEAAKSQEFRGVLEHLEQEAVKTQQVHDEQVQQITESEQNALQALEQVIWYMYCLGVRPSVLYRLCLPVSPCLCWHFAKDLYLLPWRSRWAK